MSTVHKYENTVESAGIILTRMFMAGLEYCREHGIDEANIDGAMPRFVAFLQTLVEPTTPTPPPSLKVVRAPETQLKLPLTDSA